MAPRSAPPVVPPSPVVPWRKDVATMSEVFDSLELATLAKTGSTGLWRVEAKHRDGATMTATTRLLETALELLRSFAQEGTVL